jgi:hypothetical protein
LALKIKQHNPTVHLDAVSLRSATMLSLTACPCYVLIPAFKEPAAQHKP